MAVSLRMDPLLEKELDLAAKRRGISKSQFIVEAVERALGRKDAFALLLKVQADEALGKFGPPLGADDATEIPYNSDASREQLIRKLQAKHHAGSAG